MGLPALDIDFAYDFKDVKHLTIKEKLTAEEMEEGLDPLEMPLTVCLTSHAYKRIYDTYGRQCDWQDIEDLIIEKQAELFHLHHGEEFAIVRADKKLALFCILYYYKNSLVLILKTVVRKVFLDKSYREIEKRVFVPENTKRI